MDSFPKDKEDLDQLGEKNDMVEGQRKDTTDRDITQ